MAIETGRVEPLFVNSQVTSVSVTIDLLEPRFFLAWITVNMVDSLDNFDRDNAIAADIFTIDDSLTAVRVFDGDHFGPQGDVANVFQGAAFAFGQRITFFLRGFGPDISAAAESVVVV